MAKNGRDQQDERRHGSLVCRQAVGRERKHTLRKRGYTCYDCLPLMRLGEGFKYATSMLHASREEGESENGRAMGEAQAVARRR